MEVRASRSTVVVYRGRVLGSQVTSRWRSEQSRSTVVVYIGRGARFAGHLAVEVRARRSTVVVYIGRVLGSQVTSRWRSEQVVVQWLCTEVEC